MKKKLLLLSLCLLFCGRSQAQAVPDNADGRLWRLCKVWGYMKYYSPMTCQVKWDSLLVANIPLMQTAGSNADFNEKLLGMLQFAGQVPPALATPVPPADSNLNLQLGWTDDNVFSAAVRDFLDTFESRAGRNDSLGCRMKRNDYTTPLFNSYLDSRGDRISIGVNYTDVDHRLLVLFHYWNIYNYFSPYRNLIDKSWDSTLLHIIPEAKAAASVPEFHFVMIKMQSATDDAHGRFSSTPFYDSIGLSYVGLGIRRIESKAVVSEVAPGLTGIAVGDVLVTIDGEPIETRLERFRNFIAASNESTFYRDAYPLLLIAKGGAAQFGFSDRNGQSYTRDLDYTMTPFEWSTLTASDPNPVWTTLCNGYGYVNMGKLMPDQVAQMYEELKDKEAIVFDQRNYPNQTLLALGPKFFAEPVISARAFIPDLQAPGRFYLWDDLFNLGIWSNPEPYNGKLFFLVNENTQSQAEYIVQYLSHATDAKVVGSQTAGADGDVSSVTYRGGLSFNFTSLGWYYDDWYQCQRNGIKIDETVTPTIQGIRDGRDEVLQSVSGCTSGIAKAEAGSLSISLYPNPVSDILSLVATMDKGDLAGLQITDVMGRTVYRQTFAKTGQRQYRGEIDVHQFNAGIYLLKIFTVSGAVQTAKFVKR